MCTTLDPDLDTTEHEQVPGVAWGQAGKNAGKNAGKYAGKYAGVAWGQLGTEAEQAQETEETSATR
jgi:hypothetical protein